MKQETERGGGSNVRHRMIETLREIHREKEKGSYRETRKVRRRSAPFPYRRSLRCRGDVKLHRTTMAETR